MVFVAATHLSSQTGRCTENLRERQGTACGNDLIWYEQLMGGVWCSNRAASAYVWCGMEQLVGVVPVPATTHFRLTQRPSAQ